MKSDGVVLRELGATQHRALVRVLAQIRTEHRARLVVLVDACGRSLAASDQATDTDLDAFASLAASAVAAASGLATLMGEPGASLLLRWGDQDLVQLEPSGDLVVAVVFQTTPPQGLERVRARLRLRRALTKIRSVLAQPAGDGSLEGIGDAEVDAVLGSLAKAAE